MTRPLPLPARWAAALLASAGVLALALGLAAGPAGAHGGDGQMDLVSADRGDGGAVELTVRLTYVADGHGVPDATVTAVVGDASAVPLEPSGEAGDYAGPVDAPPGSTIRVTSVDPVVTLEVPAPAGAATTTTGAPTTTGATATTEAATTTEATTTTATTAPQGNAVIVDRDEGGLSTGAMAAIGVAVVGVAAAGIFAAYKVGQNKDPDTDADTDASAGPPGSAPRA